MLPRNCLIRRLDRGLCGSLVEPQAAINRYSAEANGTPKSVVWPARPQHIPEKVRRGKRASDAIR